MIYREAGQFKTSYGADQAMLPVAQDRWGVALVVAVMLIAVPLIASEYVLQAILIPFLILSLAAIGLNLLTGYAGQLSLGTAAFMAVGGYMAYKFTTSFPDLNLIVVFVLSGVCAAAVGLVFGIPSLRIKGFYLAVATLAAQFFLNWTFNKVPWFYNYNSSGTITVPPREILGVMVGGPTATAETRYLIALVVVIVLTVVAKNLVRGRVGRSWMAIRDMDIAAEIVGFRPYQTKLLAFAISSFYCGVAGGDVPVPLSRERGERSLFDRALVRGAVHGDHRRAREPARLVPSAPRSSCCCPSFSPTHPSSSASSCPSICKSTSKLMVFGGLIVYFLIVEPRGLARLWQIAKEKLRKWPFPY